MEATSNYHAPVALALQGDGIYVSIVNAIRVHDYGNNSFRRAKTDKKDAIKLANYGLVLSLGSDFKVTGLFVLEPHSIVMQLYLNTKKYSRAFRVIQQDRLNSRNETAAVTF